MNGNSITMEGNLTRDPELREITTSRGPSVVANTSVARSYKVGDEERAEFFDISIFGDMARNVAASLSKGDRVLFEGRLQQRKWTTEDGQNRSAVSIVVDSIGPSLRWSTAITEKVVREAQPPTQAELAEESF